MNRNEAQVEAVACADAHASNAGLPTYTDLLTALESAVASFDQFVKLNRIPANTNGLRDARNAVALVMGYELPPEE